MMSWLWPLLKKCARCNAADRCLRGSFGSLAEVGKMLSVTSETQIASGHGFSAEPSASVIEPRPMFPQMPLLAIDDDDVDVDPEQKVMFERGKL